MITATKNDDELEFLPAALEIQQTPPLPISRYIIWSIMAFFTISVIWACVSEIDIVSVAMGKIVPSSRVKIIQPLETGVIRAIYVKEGDAVNAGDILVELDPTLSSANQTQTKEQQLALKLDRARIQIILDTVNGKEATGYFLELPEATPSQIKLQKERIKKHLNEYFSLLEALKDEKKQRRAERSAINDRIQQLDATIPLITERAKSLHDLLETSMVPRVQWLELEQERIFLPIIVTSFGHFS